MSRYSSSGFTLVEVLIAGVILGLAVAVMGTAVSRGYAALAEARDERHAAILLDDLLTKVDMLGPARVASEGPREGKFDGADERFSWSVDIENRPQGHLYDVTATLTWKSGAREKSVSIHTYLNDPVSSRDSTVKWKDL
jgi:prepilin-type N-terminal cleavage/methylation domain-containing protein